MSEFNSLLFSTSVKVNTIRRIRVSQNAAPRSAHVNS